MIACVSVRVSMRYPSRTRSSRNAESARRRSSSRSSTVRVTGSPERTSSGTCEEGRSWSRSPVRTRQRTAVAGLEGISRVSGQWTAGEGAESSAARALDRTPSHLSRSLCDESRFRGCPLPGEAVGVRGLRIDGEGEHHPALVVLGDVAVSHPAAGIGDVEQGRLSSVPGRRYHSARLWVPFSHASAWRLAATRPAQGRSIDRDPRSRIRRKRRAALGTVRRGVRPAGARLGCVPSAQGAPGTWSLGACTSRSRSASSSGGSPARGRAGRVACPPGNARSVPRGAIGTGCAE